MGHQLPRPLHRTDSALPRTRPARPREGQPRRRAATVAIQFRLPLATEPLLTHRRDAEVIATRASHRRAVCRSPLILAPKASLIARYASAKGADQFSAWSNAPGIPHTINSKR